VYALALVALGLSRTPPPEVAEAAAQFAVPPVVARMNWNLACRHPAHRGAEVRAWNRPDVVGRWQLDCEWRIACWCKLDDVLYHRCPVAWKLRSLAQLRDLLGDEAFALGHMPAPIPNYRD